MKLTITFALLATAGLAVAFDLPSAPTEKAADHDAAGEHASCCGAAVQGPVRNSYLELANPPGPEEVTGKVKGKIVFEGDERPEAGKLEITERQGQGCTEDGSPVKDDTRALIIAKEGGIKNAVIEISVRGAELKVPEKPIELDQVQCRFDPHVVLIPAGATVDFLNSDAVSHNVHLYATKNPGFNKTIGAGSKDSQKFEKAEAIEVKCDIHPWMQAWLYVTDSPYATISAADGSFEIANLRPGNYKLDIWHEKLGKAKADVTIKEDGSSEMVEVKLSEKASSGRRRR